MTRLPNRHDEDWRWADLRLADALIGTPAPANDELPDVQGYWLDVPGKRLLFVGGRAIDQVENPPAPDTQAPPHPLADLASVGATSGTTIRLADGEDGGTVQILHMATAGASHGVTRLVLGAHASLTLIETFADEAREHWSNHRLDCTVGEGASLVRIVRIRTKQGLVSERAYADLGASARYTQLMVASSAGAVRSEALIAHRGAGAHAQVNGILLGDGKAGLDALTRLEHAVPETTSGQIWRLVAAGQSQVSVSGGVNVARHAQKTDAEQSLKALVLKRTASANLKPELEIFADDVKCAHGCTVGELDKASLFYLQSRGIPLAQAEALLTRAFVADALEAIGEPALHEALETETRQWLEERA